MQADSIPQEEFAFRKEVLERLTRMETTLAPLANGRVASIEADVDGMKESRARERGIVVGISVAISAGFALIKAHLGLP